MTTLTSHEALILLLPSTDKLAPTAYHIDYRTKAHVITNVLCSMPQISTVITLCMNYTSILIRHTLGHYRLSKAPAPNCMASYAHTCFSLALHRSHSESFHLGF